MKTTAVLLLLLSSPALSQVTFTAYRAPSFTLDFTNTPFLMKPLDVAWKEGKTLGFAAEVNTSDVLALAAAVEILQYDFTFYPVFSVPNSWTWRRGTVGDRSTVYHLFVDLCVPTRVREDVEITYSTGIGYVYEDIGELRTTWGQLYGPDFTVRSQYPDNRYWAHSFGVGIRWFVVDMLGLDIGTRYYTDYHGTLGITYSSGVALQLRNI